jgi:hypothetical protein
MVVWTPGVVRAEGGEVFARRGVGGECTRLVDDLVLVSVVTNAVLETEVEEDAGVEDISLELESESSDEVLMRDDRFAVVDEDDDPALRLETALANESDMARIGVFRTLRTVAVPSWSSTLFGTLWLSCSEA